MSKYFLGFFIGIICAVIFLIIAIALKFKNKKQTEYDERQLIARNTAYKYSFFTLMFYCIFCGMLDFAEVRWAETMIQMFLGMFISITVFVIICIFKDAYFGIETGRKNIYQFLAISIIIASLQIYSFISITVFGKKSVITDGIINEYALSLLCAVTFFIMIVATIIKIVISKKEREEE